MKKFDQPEINPSELQAELRKAMARHVLKRHALFAKPSDITPPSHSAQNNPTFANPPLTVNFVSPNLSRSMPKAPKPPRQAVFERTPDDHYSLVDLLKFHDADFLSAAYQAILKREPDHFGYDHYLGQLRAGHIDKVDLLAILRNSTEGQLQNVQIKGLALPTFIRRLWLLPVIGYPIRLATDLLRLPVLMHRLRQQEAYLLAQEQRLAEHADEMATHIDSVNDAFAGYLSSVSAAITDLLSSSQSQTGSYEQLIQRLEGLAREQQTAVVKLRDELRAQIEKERNDSQQQASGIVRQLQAMIESSSHDTRDHIARLESSARAWVAKAEDSARASVAQLEVAGQARLAKLESSFAAKLAGIESSANEINTKLAHVESAAGELQDRIGSVEVVASDLSRSTDKLTSASDATQAEVEKVYQQLQHARAELTLQGRRMALILEEARSRLPQPFDQQQLGIIASEDQHKLDELYAELEDNFRGSQQEIKERFRTYLPQIKSLGVISEMPIVDLGCGRGEWLELLQEEGYRASGVDINHVLLDRCRARGLDVVENDALTYLRGLPDNSLSAVTGFHIIEHLQIEVMISLFDEILRVLHPGGLVIFETPNPENVLVGSNFFYFDPTHRNPVPSLLVKFLLESRGFSRIEVMNLHGWDEARIGGKNELTARFNELFYGPMDYAIAGWKVAE